MASAKEMKRKVIIEGGGIFLREVVLSDATATYCEWINDPEVNQYMECRFIKATVKKLQDYIRQIRNNPDNLLLAIVLKDKNRHIGNIKIGPIDRNHKFAKVGIIIGEKSFWRKGFATKAMKLAIDYAFNTLGLHKLTAGVYANNSASVRVFEKSGFSAEGVEKKQYYYNGQYVDCVSFGLLKDEIKHQAY
jgi:RimJ/RimL family protein N-acetyltransferase